MPERRSLSIDSLDQIMPEVDRLLLGHETAGKWTLGQICNHLCGAMRASVEGIPFKAPWIVRTFVGPFARRTVLGKGRMPEGVHLPEKLAPSPACDARAEAEALRATIAYYRGHPETRDDHPIMGRLTPAEWDRMHCVHAAHHLSFAVPTT